MCTIENSNDLCKGRLEAVSGVMDPVAESCGRDAQVSACGGTQKNLTCHTPLALRAGVALSTLMWHPAPRALAACVRSPRRARPAGGDRGHIRKGRLIFLYSALPMQAWIDSTGHRINGKW